jgi:hypothetical protein
MRIGAVRQIVSNTDHLSCKSSSIPLIRGKMSA